MSRRKQFPDEVTIGLTKNNRFVLVFELSDAIDNEVVCMKKYEQEPPPATPPKPSATKAEKASSVDQEPQSPPDPDQTTPKRRKRRTKAEKTAKGQTIPPSPETAPGEATEENLTPVETLYICLNLGCKSKRKPFPASKRVNARLCPTCLSADIIINPEE